MATATTEVKSNVDDSKFLLPQDVKFETAVVGSGEEDEEVLFCQISKAYVFIKEDIYGGVKRTNYWKERGKGDMRILKNKKTGVQRVLLRQEKTKKVAVNFRIGAAATLEAMSEKSWTTKTAGDVADGNAVGEEVTFAFRFRDSDRAGEFEEAFMAGAKANGDLGNSSESKQNEGASIGNDVGDSVVGKGDAGGDAKLETLVGDLIAQIRNSDWLEKQSVASKQTLKLPDGFLQAIQGAAGGTPPEEQNCDGDLASLLTSIAELTTKDSTSDDKSAPSSETRTPLSTEEVEALMDPLQVEMLRLLDAKKKEAAAKEASAGTGNDEDGSNITAMPPAPPPSTAQ